MKPLSKKSRRISWALLFVVFLAISPFILYYSFGYRFDDELGFVETGGVYIHSDVSNTQVFVNGEYFKNNGVLLKNTLIQKLDPKKIHTIDVIKDGYHSWHKDLPVVEGLVTEASALMLPIKIDTLAIYPYFDEEGNGTTTKTVEGKDLVENPTFIEMVELFEEAVATTTASVDSATSTTDIVVEVPDYFLKLGIEDTTKLNNLIERGDQVAWLDNGNIVMYWIGEKDSIPFYYCVPLECRDSLKLDWETNIARFDFLPDRNEVALVLNPDGLWAAEMDDRSERNIQPVYLGADIDFRINENDRIVVSDGGVFFELRI